MAFNPSPFGPKPQWELSDGTPAVGYKLFTYVAGSVNTKQSTYTDYTGGSTNTNPIVLNSLGQPTTEIWLASGQTYKFVLAPSTDTDPPTSPVWSVDGLKGINDTTVTIDQWVAGPAPTYVSGTSFTLTGDQTTTLHTGRRLKIVDAVTTKYATISSATYDGISLTTVNVTNDGAALSSPLSSVSYGLLSKASPSWPSLVSAGTGISVAFTAGVAVISNAIPAEAVCDFRLTLTSGTAITTADVTGASAQTIYCTPYKGNRIALYDGSTWNVRTSAEFSLALGTLTGSLPYDVFCYDNAGVPTLEFLAWSGATARATALTTQDGVYVKTGATTRRYLGTFYTNSATQTEDSIAKRYLWNYYNRVQRTMRVVEATASWAYSTATFRQARETATNQLDYVQGVSEDPVNAIVNVNVSNDSASAVLVGPGIGVDSTTVNSAQVMAPGQTGPNANQRASMMAEYRGYPGVGRHTLVWGEYATATGVTTWYGTQSPTNISSISGWLMG